MKYPEFLSTNATIGVVAPSAGCRQSDTALFDNAVKKLTNIGYHIKFASHLYGNTSEAASADGKTRAFEFTNLYLDDEVDFIMLLCGGELELEMLPYIDFQRLSLAKPKYVMGSSDNTNLTFTMTTLLDTASIFGINFMDYGYKNWDLSIQQAYEVITGKTFDLHSYDYYVSNSDYESCRKEIETRIDKLPQSLSDKIESFEGRLIGGTLDCLLSLIGTKFDNVNYFINNYYRDGFVLYLESCDLNILSQYRGLWQLKNAGWFQQCKGILYGRALNDEMMEDVDTKKMLEKIFLDMNIPVIYNCDIGHIKPAWPIINGAYSVVEYRDHQVKIGYIRD